MALEEKLGPILWQLPPSFSFNPDKLSRFFDLLPRTAKSAALLASEHDSRLKYNAVVKAKRNRPIRYAVEFRHDGFCDSTFIKLLRRHDISLAVADTVDWPLLIDVTAPFIYVRLHGSRRLYVSGYSDKALKLWATRLRGWTKGKRVEGPYLEACPRRSQCDVYVYFDNDAKVRAPQDAQRLLSILA